MLELLQHLASAGEITKQGQWVYEDPALLACYRFIHRAKLLQALLHMFLFSAVGNEVKIAFIITRKRNNVIVSFGTLKVQSFMLTEVRDCEEKTS